MAEEMTAGREAEIRTRQTIRLVVIAAILVIVAALIMDNRESVTLGYVVGERDASLVVALVAAFALGVVVGWLASRRRTKHRD